MKTCLGENIFRVLYMENAINKSFLHAYCMDEIYSTFHFDGFKFIYISSSL